MRVCIIGPAYPLRGGIAHYVYWLWRELTERGHTVQVISFRRLYPPILFPGTTEFDWSQLAFDAEAVPILKPLSPITWRRAFKHVMAFGPEVVIFEWWQPFFAPLVGMLARAFRKSGIKVIVECHNVLPHEPSPLDRVLIRFGLTPADHLVTHSIKDREDLLEFFPDKNISTAPLPAISAFMKSNTQSRDGRTILFFGKVRRYKGLDVLLSAMPEVLSKVDCELHVVGEFYDPVERYRQLISDLDIGRHVHLDNRYVSNEEVAEVFEQADVLVLPYTSASQSGVARIALSNGLPIIASQVGGLGEVIKQGVNGLLFLPGDSQSLATQIVRYFSDT